MRLVCKDVTLYFARIASLFRTWRNRCCIYFYKSIIANDKNTSLWNSKHHVGRCMNMSCDCPESFLRKRLIRKWWISPCMNTVFTFLQTVTFDTLSFNVTRNTCARHSVEFLACKSPPATLPALRSAPFSHSPLAIRSKTHFLLFHSSWAHKFIATASL